MQLYCKNGRVIAWHDDAQAVPPSAYGEGVLQVPFAGSLDSLGRFGDVPPEGEPDTRSYAAPAITLNDLKQSLFRQIDERAEALRLMLLTAGVGQALEYQETQTQAVAALKAATPVTAEDYPMLAATIGVDIDPKTGAPAEDVLGVARSVDAARTAWLTVGAAIRGVRLTAKKAIDEAGSVVAVMAAADAIVWPSLD